MRLSLRIIFLLFITSNNAYATSWLDGVKATYSEVKQKVAFKNAPKQEKLLEFPKSAPKGWVYSYFLEPVFDSKMAVLQAGLEHKETVILVHGLGQLGMKDWYSVIPYLATKYHVIALDLPGFGYSQKPEGRYSPTQYAAVIKSVSQQFSKGNITLIGHSMGGAVSLRFASLNPKALNRLILVDVAGVLNKTAFVKNSAKFNLNNEKSPEKLKNIVAQASDLSGSLIEMVSASTMSDTIQNSEITWHFLKSSPNANAALSLIEEDFSFAIQHTAVETFIIWGAEDSIAPLRTAKVLEKHMPNATLSVIDGAGHVPMKSHNKLFLALLERSLSEGGTKKKTIESLKNKGDLICNNQFNQTYSGIYNKAYINNCSNIKLINVSFNELVIKDSVVTAENITIKSERSAFTAIESVVNITNGFIHTQEAIKLSGSRLDIAGGDIIAHGNSITVDVSSKLIFSVSHIQDKFYQGHIHGTYTLKNKSIAQILME